MKKLFIIVNLDSFFLSHRKDIALMAVKSGYDVTIIAGDTGKGEYIKSLGLKFINLPINKAGMKLSDEFRTFSFLYKLLGKERPDVVHLVGMKLILWGGLAARLRRIKGLVSAVSGLGVLFSPEYNKGIRKIISLGVLTVMRFIHRVNNTYCIFHNLDDLDLFVNHKIVHRENCIRTMGSGIDLNSFAYTKEPNVGKLKVLFTARMVEDKGVLVLIEAAQKLRVDYQTKVQFLLCGGLDTNPMAVTKEKLEELCDGEYIQWLGKRDDVHQLLQDSHIFAFPSFYKEGLPKSCIEAAAIGRPIITCNSVGCRDTVIDGETGFLVPIKDSQTLAEKLKVLFNDAELRNAMGVKARKFAEENFSLETVVATHMEIYEKLMNS